MTPWEALFAAADRQLDCLRRVAETGAGREELNTAHDDVARCRMENGLLFLFLLRTALNEEGVRKHVWKTLSDFRLADVEARCWMDEMLGRIKRLERDVINLKDENAWLRNELWQKNEEADDPTCLCRDQVAQAKNGRKA